jgi:hypothetical protein
MGYWMGHRRDSLRGIDCEERGGLMKFLIETVEVFWVAGMCIDYKAKRETGDDEIVRRK